MSTQRDYHHRCPWYDWSEGSLEPTLVLWLSKVFSPWMFPLVNTRNCLASIRASSLAVFCFFPVENSGTEAGSELFPGLMQRRQGLHGHCLLFAPHQTQRQKINAAAFPIAHKFRCTHTVTHPHKHAWQGEKGNRGQKCRREQQCM